MPGACSGVQAAESEARASGVKVSANPLKAFDVECRFESGAVRGIDPGIGPSQRSTLFSRMLGVAPSIRQWFRNLSPESRNKPRGSKAKPFGAAIASLLNAKCSTRFPRLVE